MPSVPSLITQYARKYGIAPRAAMAVAMAEGGLHWGAVGDSGSSFGPFQLHEGGALPAGRGAAWANSPAGIRYALHSMAKSGASGLKGRAAITSIVRDFERPAAPGAEIQRAMGYLQELRQNPLPQGNFTQNAPGRATYMAYDPKDITEARRKSMALSLLGMNPVYSAAIGKKIAEQVQPQQYSINVPGMGGQFPTNPPGAGPASLMAAIIRMAQKRGYSTLENPLVDPVAQVHVPGSMHYQTFRDRPGTGFDESRVGRAVDISGGNLMQLLHSVIRRYGKSPFSEIIYDPWGSYFDGTQSRSPYGGHGTHIHFGL